MKLISLYIRILFLICAIFILSCGSGEYEIERYKENYTEKTLVFDTTKTVVIEDNNNDNNNDNQIKKITYHYVVQVGAFVIKANFDKFYEKAKQDLGGGVYFVFQNDLYKIRLGSFSNRAEAMQLLEKVIGLGYSDAFIITTRKN